MTKRKFLVTGGAGFVGSNLVNRLISRGDEVVILDNLSRKGVASNLEWLEANHGKSAFKFIRGDVRELTNVVAAMSDCDVVLHCAGQVAVTTSVNNPREDFEINALGTLNVLEAARNSSKKPLIVFTSTNKVYGGLSGLKLRETATRYEIEDMPNGVTESYPLDFYSPYGCSKGTADQYVHDYGRIYNLQTVVLRMSCIYGTRQFGIEDQGWIAWFLIAAVMGRPITIYGDGKQTRDVLFIDDLVRAFEMIVDNVDKSAGQVFNVGGGLENSVSVWHELAPILARKLGRKPEVSLGDWRPGDQKVYISDTSKIRKILGWSPQVSVEEGVGKVFDWISNNKQLFESGANKSPPYEKLLIPNTAKPLGAAVSLQKMAIAALKRMTF